MTSRPTLRLTPGDSVRVKPAVIDPDFGYDLGGWQGRVVQVDARVRPPTVEIEWDSLTLAAMPAEQIAHCEAEGLDWRRMVLGLAEVEPAIARDSAEAVLKIGQQIQRQHAWDWLGEAGQSIQRVLAGIDRDDEQAQLKAWHTHLLANWQLPFEAVVDQYQTLGPLQVDDQVKVLSISAIDDSYGLIVHLQVGRRRYDFPLCDLKVSDQASSTYQLVDDYRTWHANR
ncbi:MAG: hypothetical protein HY870_10730 [Chloroflexi bacterium]|nr:hypothetical protein [Chloroflexota bacterium]